MARKKIERRSRHSMLPKGPRGRVREHKLTPTEPPGMGEKRAVVVHTRTARTDMRSRLYEAEKQKQAKFTHKLLKNPRAMLVHIRAWVEQEIKRIENNKKQILDEVQSLLSSHNTLGLSDEGRERFDRLQLRHHREIGFDKAFKQLSKQLEAPTALDVRVIDEDELGEDDLG